jgi:signal transduction histidine kinase
MTIQEKKIIPFILVLYTSLLAIGWSSLSIIGNQNRERAESYLRLQAEKIALHVNNEIESLDLVGTLFQEAKRLGVEIPQIPEFRTFTPSPDEGGVNDDRNADCRHGSICWQIVKKDQHFRLEAITPVNRLLPEKSESSPVMIARQIFPMPGLRSEGMITGDFLIFTSTGSLLGSFLGNELSPASTDVSHQSGNPYISDSDLKTLRFGSSPPMQSLDFNGRHLALFSPIRISGETRLILGILYPRDRMESTLKKFSYFTIAILSLVTLVLSVLYHGITVRLNQFIAELVQFTRRVSEGDFSLRLQETGSSEYATLALLLNKMTESLERMKKFERESFLFEKLSSLGQLSAGIAHEIKNPLMVLEYSVNHLNKKFADPEIKEDLEVIRRNARRIEVVVEKLANFSRPEGGEAKETIELGSLFEESFFFLKKAFEINMVKIDCELNSTPLRVIGRKNAINQAFSNILLNALEAMPEGGDLKVRFSEESREPNGHFALFSVTDSGCGIDPSIRVKLFDPFFTTKAKGTGLGLSITYQIMAELGGFIEVHSPPPKAGEEHRPMDTDKSECSGKSTGTLVILGFPLV